jgi:hypothetical protein
MKHIVILSALSAMGAAWAITGGASAQMNEAPERHLAAPTNAAEIEISPGFATAFGNIDPNRSLSDVVSGGGGLELGIGYRISPYFLLGVYGTGTRYGNTADTANAAVWGSTMGIQAQVHFLPHRVADPFIGLGTGAMGQWVVLPNSAGTITRWGLDLARLRVGVDYRVSPDVAIAPVVGGDMGIFLTEQSPGQSFGNIASPRVNGMFFAGLTGRFDLGGMRETDRTAEPNVAKF